MIASTVIVAFLLIMLNGFFVAVEFAYTASRRPKLEEMAAAGNRFARWALASMNQLPVTFAGAQLGIAAASLSLGFLIESSLEGAFEDLYALLGVPEGSIATLAVVTALLIVSFAHNVLGEMAPKNATITAPERVALILAAPFRAYVTLLRPVILALSGMAGAVLRLFGVRTRYAVEVSHSADDIASLVKTIGAGGIIQPNFSRILTSAIRFQEVLVAEVMAPRPDLVAMSVDESVAAFEQTVISTGHSRIPVYGSGLDDIRGFVHAKDLITVPPERRSSPVDARLIRPIPVVPETMSIAPLMQMMRSEGVHIALAVDEHGSISGLVTLEDIAEELVGEIRDEHDIRDVMEMRPAGRNRYLVAGQTRLARVAELGVQLEEGDYETVGGYVMHRLGRVPRHGDSVKTERFEMSVRRMDRRRVREVELRVIPPSSAPDDE